MNSETGATVGDKFVRLDGSWKDLDLSVENGEEEVVSAARLMFSVEDGSAMVQSRNAGLLFGL